MLQRGQAPGTVTGAPGVGPARPGRQGRAWRWLGWALGGLGALLLVAGLGVWFLLGSLNQSWLETRIVALVKAETGLTLAYDALEVSLWRGLRVRSLRILSPPEFAAVAPDFVHLEQLELRASLLGLGLGGRSLEALHIGRLALAVVQDPSGKNSLSTLFPSEPAAAPSPPLSQALSHLPSATLAALDVDAIELRFIELGSGAPQQTALSGLGLHGHVQSGPGGLQGTELQLRGAPALRVERQLGERVAHAELGLELGLEAPDARSLALRARLDLRAQDVLPAWARPSELLQLQATLHCEPEARKSSFSVSGLRALDGAVSLAAQADVLDAPESQISGSGRAHVQLGPLPAALGGLSLAELELDLGAEQLSWDGAHAAGALDYSGRLRGLALERPEGHAELAELALTGEGRVERGGGSFQAQLRAPSLRWRAPELAATLDGLNFTLNGSASEPSGAQRVQAQSVLLIERAVVRKSTGEQLQLAGSSVRTRLAGTFADFAARRLPELASSLAIEQLSAGNYAQSASLEQLSASGSIEQLAFDASSASGVQGAASLGLIVPRLSVFPGAASKTERARRAALRLRGLELRAELPLSLTHATGTLALAALQTPERSLGGLALDAELDSPLGWGAEARGGARVDLKGSLGRFDAGVSRGSFDALRVHAERPEPDRYRLELDATASSLVAAGTALPGRLSAELRADAAPGLGTLSTTTALRTDQGAALDLKLDARFDRQSQRLSYQAALSAEKLESLASTLAGVAPSSARLQLAGARLQGSAEGEFSGVLRAEGAALPAPVANPLSSARGSQKLALALHGLDYRTPERTLAIPELELELASVHQADGAGNAHASLRAPRLVLEGGGSSLRLSDLDQKLTAKFDRSPDRGVVDVRATLGLGAVAQSWLPAYPVRGLELVSNLEVDHLHSIFLRSLSLENAATGTKLAASGALELRTEGGASGAQSIVGREALSFEGRLDQPLEPLERLGVAGRASGSLAIPFRLESGGLLGYRFFATLQANQLSVAQKDGSLVVERLNGVIPIVEEFALLPSGPVLGEGPRVSPLSDTRFFDVHPFLTGDDYVTADSISFGRGQSLGPIAANVRIERTDFLIDQLQAGYRGGQIVGQVRVAYRGGDPILRLRVNVTGLRSGQSQEVLDANSALTFVPAAMTLDGKVQIVRASREHLLDILDVLDPFHESANANRVRHGLALGYPKFVRFQLQDGAVDTKVELGGLAQVLRIDEIKAVPLGPILQRYVAPLFAEYLRSGAEKKPPAHAEGP